MPEFIQVLTTFDKVGDAEQLARHLVENRLAACVQISGPMTSIYRWQGATESSQEWACTIKTRRDLFPQLESVIQSLHPYDEPEIVALPMVAGSAGYLKWVESETRKA